MTNNNTQEHNISKNKYQEKKINDYFYCVLFIIRGGETVQCIYFL